MPNLVPRAFPLKNGGKSPGDEVVECQKVTKKLSKIQNVLRHIILLRFAAVGLNLQNIDLTFLKEIEKESMT